MLFGVASTILIMLVRNIDMTKQTMKQNQPARRESATRARPHFSKATLEVAKRNLEKSKAQSDEGFLIRAEMDRKLSSL